MFDWQTTVWLLKSISYAAIPLFLLAAYNDIKAFRLPNRFVLAIGLLGTLRLVVLHDPISAMFAAAMIIIAFAVGTVLFRFGLIGGGDVKLIMATLLLIRYHDFYEFFVLMAVSGLLLTFVMLFLRHYSVFLGARVAASVATTRLSVPYGVAIAGAAIMTLLLQPIMYRYSVFPTPFLLW